MAVAFGAIDEAFVVCFLVWAAAGFSWVLVAGKLGLRFQPSFSSSVCVLGKVCFGLFACLMLGLRFELLTVSWGLIPSVFSFSLTASRMNSVFV